MKQSNKATKPPDSLLPRTQVSAFAVIP